MRARGHQNPTIMPTCASRRQQPRRRSMQQQQRRGGRAGQWKERARKTSGSGPTWAERRKGQRQITRENQNIHMENRSSAHADAETRGYQRDIESTRHHSPPVPRYFAEAVSARSRLARACFSCSGVRGRGSEASKPLCKCCMGEKQMSCGLKCKLRGLKSRGLKKPMLLERSLGEKKGDMPAGVCVGLPRSRPCIGLPSMWEEKPLRPS